MLGEKAEKAAEELLALGYDQEDDWATGEREFHLATIREGLPTFKIKGWRLNPPARGVSLRSSLRPTVLNHDFRGLIHKNYIGNHVTMAYFHFRATCNNVVSENLLI